MHNLMCGKAPRLRAKQTYVAIQAYIDDSRTDGEVLVLAGFIARSAAWDVFSLEWERALQQKGLEEFKASEWGVSDVEIEKQGFFYRIIEQHVAATLAVAVPIPALEKVAKEFGGVLIDFNPYLFAFKAMVNLVAQNQHDLMSASEPIDFLFDEQQGEKDLIVKAWDMYKSSIPMRERKVTGSPPRFLNSKTHMPVQAADLAAWWHRKWFRENRSIRGWPYPWKELKPLGYLKFSFEEAEYRENFEALSDHRVAIDYTWNGKFIGRAWAEISFQEPYQVFDPFRQRPDPKLPSSASDY